MTRDTAHLRLPPELRDAAADIARKRDITLGQLIRDLLAREVARHNNAKPSVRADERLVAPLRARLADDLAFATGWEDLDKRLKAKGYAFQAAGGGLALHVWPDGRRVCKASELGFSYARLMHRFRTPFPGHPQGPPARLDPAPCNDAAPPMATGGADEDFDVIERF